MAPSRQSSSSSIASEEAESECFQFIVGKVHRFQAISIHGLHGFLNCLDPSKRSCVGKSTSDLLTYLRQYPEAFKITKGKVYLMKRPKDLNVKLPEDSDSSSTNSLPTELEGTGHIVRLFPTYGFLKVDSPISTSVYFAASAFGNAQTKILTEFDLNHGQNLRFRAGKNSNCVGALYRATRVWLSDADYDRDKASNCVELTSFRQTDCKRVKFSDTSSEISCSSLDSVMRKRHKKNEFKSSKNVSSGNMKIDDNLESEMRYSGYIHVLFDSYGFIRQENEEKVGNVFFHQKNIVNGKSKRAIFEIFKEGDYVEYTRVPTDSKTSKAKWKAVKVWVVEQTNGCSYDEIYYSRSEHSDSEENEACDPRNDEKIDDSSFPKRTLEFENVKGKIYPNVGKTAEIKYGKHSVYAETCPFFFNETKIEDLMWQFAEGEEVMFDAVKIQEKRNDYYYEAILVWVGKKPNIAPSCESSTKIVSEANRAECRDNVSIQSNNSNSSNAKSYKSSNYSNWGDSPTADEYEEGNVEIERSKSNATETVLAATNSKLKADPIIENTTSFDIVEEPSYKVVSSKDIENLNEFTTAKTSLQNQHSKSNATKTVLMAADTKLKTVTIVENTTSFDIVEKPFCKVGSYKDIGNLNKFTATETSEEIQSSGIAEPEVVMNKSTKQGKDSVKVPGIYMFEKVEGKITKLLRFLALVSCPSLHKPVSILLNDLYYKSRLLKGKVNDPHQVISEGDLIYFNGFEITDDNGSLWQKVTLAWIGDKPKKVFDSEPQEFIDVQNLKVSGNIPTWNHFRKKNKKETDDGRASSSIATTKESMRPLNTINVRKKETHFLCAAQVEFEEAENNRNVDGDKDRKDEEQILINGIPEELQYQFSVIKNSMNKLRQNFSSYDTLKDFDTLIEDVHNAINSVLAHVRVNPIPECVKCQSICDGREFGSMSRELKEDSKMVSREVQTLITGDVISHAIFPQ